MKIITIANQKGGVAKTTTALNVGDQLELKGYKVLYLDLDKQRNFSETLKGDTAKPGVYEILTQELKARDVIQHTSYKADLITANVNLAKIDKALDGEISTETRLKESLESVRDLYDYIVIDTALGVDQALFNALTCTNYLIMVTDADTDAIKGLTQLNQIVEKIKKHLNPGLIVDGILLTRYSDRSNINKAIRSNLEKIATQLQTKVFKTFIRESTAIKESKTRKQRLTEYAPKSNGNLDYKAFTEELLKDLESEGVINE